MSIYYAIGGGNFLKEENILIDQKLILDTKKVNPQMLYIPAASYNEIQNIQMVQPYFQKLGVAFNYLLAKDLNQLEAYLDKVDIIYFGAGTTSRLVKHLEQLKLKETIIKAAQKGIIIAGISAGAIMLFDYGFGDQFAYYNKDEMKGYHFVKGLGILSGIFVPHYQNQGLLAFHDEVKNMPYNAFALEDMSALKISDDGIEVIKCKGRMAVYFNQKKDYLLEPLSSKIYDYKIIKGA